MNRDRFLKRVVHMVLEPEQNHKLDLGVLTA